MGDFIRMSRCGHQHSFPVMASYHSLLAKAALAIISILNPTAGQAPQVKLGNTTLIGRDITVLRQEFFGGNSA